MNKKILIALLAILLVAGCVGEAPKEEPKGLGLEILSFTSDQDTVYTGKTGRLTLEVENQGEKTINGAKTYLIGSNLGTSSGTTWYNTTGTHVQTILSMRPADPSRDIPAEKRIVNWRLNAPDVGSLSRGQSRTDQFIGRVYYDYQTQAIGSIWVYTEAEATATRERDESLTKSTFTSSKAPVKVEVSVAPDPVVVASGTEMFTIYLEITNEGGGTIYKNNTIDYTDISLPLLTENDLNYIYIEITKPTDLTITGCDGNQEVIGGEETVIICDAEVSSSAVAAKKGFPVTFTVDYGYYIDKTTSITVIGK